MLLAELVLNKLWQFNTSTHQWSEIKAQAPPTRRVMHGFAALEGFLFVFGGMIFPGKRHAHDHEYYCKTAAFIK
jgi:hypothetical protein